MAEKFTKITRFSCITPKILRNFTRKFLSIRNPTILIKKGIFVTNRQALPNEEGRCLSFIDILICLMVKSEEYTEKVQYVLKNLTSL